MLSHYIDLETGDEYDEAEVVHCAPSQCGLVLDCTSYITHCGVHVDAQYDEEEQ